MDTYTTLKNQLGLLDKTIGGCLKQGKTKDILSLVQAQLLLLEVIPEPPVPKWNDDSANDDPDAVDPVEKLEKQEDRGFFA